MLKPKTTLLLVPLLATIISLSFAQQNQIPQKPNPEIERLENRISELESKLQTVENVEKMELAAKLAEANAKLANAEFGRFERELRDSNNQWLRNGSLLLLAILSAIGAALWFWFKSITNQLIADEVEKNLNDFQETVEQLEIIKNQLEILEEAHAASMLSDISHNYNWDEESYSEKIKVIRDDALLNLFGKKDWSLPLRYKAGEVLAVRECPQFVSPALEFLNSVIDSEFDWKDSYFPERHLEFFVGFLGQIHTRETYEGLMKFLDRLTLTGDPELKDLLLTKTTFSLAWVSLKLNVGDSVSMLRRAVPHLQIGQQNLQALKNLARHFDIFNEPEGIKEILTHHAANRMPEVETRCLELLEKHDPDFVKEWKAQKGTTNTETEESE